MNKIHAGNVELIRDKHRLIQLNHLLHPQNRNTIMKLIKVLTFIVGAIALFPAVSHAENVNANNQIVDLSSVVVGNNNVNSTTIRQSILNAQTTGLSGSNTTGTNQVVTGRTQTVGDYNINLTDIQQKYGSLQMIEKTVVSK